MQKSVVIIGPAYPLRGGLASFNERLARQFIADGYDTSIYTFSLQYPGFLFPGTTQYSDEPPPDDLKINVGINSINPLNWLIIGWKLKKMHPDYIIVRYWLPFMGPCLGTILRLVRWNKHTQIVCIADNIIPHEKRIGDDWFTRYFVKPIHGFVTMSGKVLEDLKQFSQAPSREVVHPLYDNFGSPVSRTQAINHLQLNEEDSYLLFFGFIRKYKGLDWLIEAFYILKQEGYLVQHPLKCIVAGEFYEDDKPYKELLSKYQLEDFILIKDIFIPDSEIKNYFSIAAGIIQPYKNATQSGVTPLAMHFEVPMIVTRVGGLPQLVPDAIGEVVDPNPKAIAEGIKKYYLRDQQTMRTNIKAEKQKYSWSVLVNTLLTLTNSGRKG